MKTSQQEKLWLFHGAGSRFSSGVFKSLEMGQHWIAKHKLTGILTQYPLDVGVYDWAIQQDLFEVKNSKHQTPQFIQGFTTAGQEHYHFEDGIQC